MPHLLSEPFFKKIPIKKDNRGWVGELLKPEDISRKNFGQISVTVPKPNQSKGNHYHRYRIEWFIVLQGKVKFTVTHIKTKVKKEFILVNTNLQFIRIPPYWYHTLTNIGTEDAIVLLYYNRPFNPLKPDTYTLEGDINV